MSLALRRFDAVIAVFRRAVRRLAAGDYGPAQIEAWSRIAEEAAMCGGQAFRRYRMRKDGLIRFPVDPFARLWPIRHGLFGVTKRA